MGGDCPRHSAGIDGADESTGNGLSFSSGLQAGHLCARGVLHPGVLGGWGPGRAGQVGEAGLNA